VVRLGKIERRQLIRSIEKNDLVERVEVIGKGFIIHYKKEKQNA